MSNIESQKQRLSAVRIRVMHEHPWFAMLLYNLAVEITEDINPPTASVNGVSIKLHPAFIDELTNDELVFLLAHEVMHVALLHIIRRNGRDPLVWNIANDVVINYILKESKVGTMPKAGIHEPLLYEKCKGLSDAIYDEIFKKSPPTPSGGGEGEDEDGKDGKGRPMPGEGAAKGSSMDNCEDSPNPHNADEEAKWKARLISATDVAQRMGRMPAGLQRLIDSIVKPKVPWQSVLAQWTRPAKTDDTSWSRPNRRFMAHGIHMPGKDGIQTDELAFLIDCSGSISNDILAQFQAEVVSAQEDTRPSGIHIIYFDSRVAHYDKFEADEEVSLNMHGGGGTAFSPCFKYMQDNDIEPAVCIVLTDLCCNDFGPQPDYPVLWVTTHPGTAPWGQIVEMD